MRQTNMTLGELIAALEGKRACSFPRCLLINEVGEICYRESSKEAEAALRKCLTAKSVEEKTLAFCWLHEMENVNITEDTFKELERFRNNPENAEIIKIGEGIIEDAKTRGKI